MGADSSFYETLVHSIKMSIHTNVPCRVVHYYPDTWEADLEVLFKQVVKSGASFKYPMILKAPVLEHVGPLSVGNVVFCGVSERALDNMQRVPFDPEFSRAHDLKDCVVIGKWKGV
jgi:hypothetical protein